MELFVCFFSLVRIYTNWISYKISMPAPVTKALLPTHAPAIFLVVVFIMMRFRPSILIRFVCVFVLIQERFQIDALSVWTEGLNASKCIRFQTKSH